ncbi:MAG: helix-turn-helix domain-containing protein [Microbacterium sp.]
MIPAGPGAPPLRIRPTNEEIDAFVLDVTAGLLTRHGVAAASMSMIASASGYSKAAVFHRFGSKDDLVDRALARCVDLGEGVLARIDRRPPGPGRDRAALSAMRDLALERPGFIALALASVTVQERGEFSGRLDRLADAMLAMFAIPLPAERADPEPLFRALGALSALATLSLFPSRAWTRPCAQG